jgi:hypothetical protein
VRKIVVHPAKSPSGKSSFYSQVEKLGARLRDWEETHMSLELKFELSHYYTFSVCYFDQGAF